MKRLPNRIVNLADVREEREMGVFNTVNTVNGNTVNDNIGNITVNIRSLNFDTFNARRFPAASKLRTNQMIQLMPAPPQTYKQFNTPVHLQTPVAMESDKNEYGRDYRG